MKPGTDMTRALAADAMSLQQLKLQAGRNPDQAAAAAARQFEALFLNMVMKSMREATPKSGLFDNDQSRLYTQMLDQQLAQHMATRGTGLADVLTRQLTRATAGAAAGDAQRTAPAVDGAALRAPSTTRPQPREIDGAALDVKRRAPAAAGETSAPTSGVLERTRGFVNRVWEHAVEAARSLGVQPHFMVGQAALESGWGRREIRTADGAPSHNLFGIKAGRGWNGPVVERATTEYVNGTPVKSVEKFRVYSSYAECFRDYASLLRGNPRYAAVVGGGNDAENFARGLQRAGYATDPAYGDKLLRIINSSTLRQSLLG